MRLLLVLLFVGSALANPAQEYLPSLEGAKVFRATIESEDKLSAIIPYREKQGYEILKYGQVRGDEIHILVTADNVDAFERFLLENDIHYSIATDDVQRAVDEEAARQRNASAIRANGRLSFTAYPRYDAIVNFLRQIASDRSDIATLLSLGYSGEGRIIYGLKISSGGTNKPAVLVEGALHSREWITVSSVTYFINEFIENANNTDLFQSVDWYFIPVLNPDGYEFTHTSYRLWRKTRKVNPGSSCRGIDGNRNFGHYWMEIGASQNPCDDTYAGPEAFSEVETQVLRDFVLANADTIKLYLSYHSYGNYFLYPWGYTTDLPDNDQELRDLAQAADDAQATVRGTRYTIGSIATALYYAAGGSSDWVKAGGGVELSYTVELQGGGLFGFDIPASEIIPVGQETFLGLRAFGEYIASKYGSAK
ncbi:carboxypeptidase B-like [Diprion similis]|uniref:carboxypeptidase B-like n=1 Tax=Diprion similis TaxID=362088 RepID=UPI001EF8DD3D|nr:carboxypeptidase B-like [Diprion similis]